MDKAKQAAKQACQDVMAGQGGTINYGDTASQMKSMLPGSVGQSAGSPDADEGFRGPMGYARGEDMPRNFDNGSSSY